MLDTKELDKQYIASTYGRYNVEFVSGKGVYLYDEHHQAYLDLTSGIGVNSLGYANDKWVEAINNQASQLAHISNLYYSKPQVEVAKYLCEHTHFKKMIFSNSGAEANEAAIKVARKYSSDRYHENRNEIITLVNSFHGRTITTLSATGQDHFHQHFDPFTPGFKYVEANNIQDLLQKVNGNTCAIMIECIQGEGGVIPLDQEFVHVIENICEYQDILLIVDEVQSGIGRCGSLFAYEKFKIKPNIVTMAKGLGNGLPIGGILLDDKVKDVFKPGDHGSTFAGNLLACSGAKVVLDYLAENGYDTINELGEYLKMRLLNMPHIIKVNGLGLMRGAVLEKGYDAKKIVETCLNKGLLILTAKDKLRFLPPLIITKEELAKAMDILEEVLNNI